MHLFIDYLLFKRIIAPILYIFTCVRTAKKKHFIDNCSNTKFFKERQMNFGFALTNGIKYNIS